MKRSPDINPGDNGIRPRRSTILAGKCSAEYAENASNGACTTEPEQTTKSRVSTDENKENATCQEAPVQKRKRALSELQKKQEDELILK
jgi:hypothetical protein